MESTSPPPPQEENNIRLIDQYVTIWKGMGLDFNDNTFNSEMKISESDKKNELESIKELLRDINYEMSFKDEFYVLDSVLKIVHSKEHGFWIKKFNVVEVKSKSRVVKTIEAFTLLAFGGDDLIEWRFKEGPPEPKPFNSDYTAVIFADPIIAPTETPAPEITEWHLASRLPEEGKDCLPDCFPEIPVERCYKHSQLSDEEELALVTELGLSLESSDEDEGDEDDIHKHVNVTYYEEGW